jgi:glycosyltransferase involved in cell wall biosynthesis
MKVACNEEGCKTKGSPIESLRGKRVAVVTFSHYPSDPRPRRAAEALAQQGMDVEVISIKQRPDEEGTGVFNGVRISRVPLKKSRGGKLAYISQYGSFIIAAFFVLAFRSLKRRYSLVHVHNMPDILVFSALIPKLLGAKVLLDLHDPMPELMQTIFNFGENSRAVRVLKTLEKMSTGFADGVLVVNQACLRIISGRSCPVEKIQVVMNAPDERIFREQAPIVNGKALRRAQSKDFVIMYHGSLVERHGLDLGVKALERIKPLAPGAELRVYGQSTPFLERVMNSVKGTELGESVKYMGPASLEKIAEAITECDIGIIPNRRSIFTEINTPTRIFEYLSQGKPVIAPRVPGIQDYFGNDDLLFFELGNADDLAGKLELAFKNRADLGKVVQRGQEVYSNHRWSAEKRRLVNLVDGLVSRPGRRRMRAVRGYAPFGDPA